MASLGQLVFWEVDLAFPAFLWGSCTDQACEGCVLISLCAVTQALDGGYIALLAVEAVRGKKLSKNLEQGILASGVLLLMSLSFFLIVRDTLNLTG